MLNLSLFRETKVYQEAKEEGELAGKLKMVSKLLQKGLSLQELAEAAEIDIETLRQNLRDLSLLRETKVYQEAKEEGKLEGKLKVVSKLLQKGLSLQEVAEIVEIDVETIRQNLKNS